MSAAILAALTVQQRTVGFAGAVSSLPPRTNVSEGGLTLLLCFYLILCLAVFASPWTS